MKKKETILVIIMGILTIGVIVLGFTHNKNRQAALLDHDYEAVSQTQSFEERKRKKEEEKRANFIESFDENREESTVADFLQYVKYGKGDTAITFYGDIEAEAPWAMKNLQELASERAFSEMAVQFVSLVDSEASLETSVADVAATNPDVVFFHTPLPMNEIVDWTWDGEPIEENNIHDIFVAYDAMKEALPETLVVLVTPIPAEELEEGGSRHQIGIDEVLASSEEYSLPVFNLHDQIMTHLSENELTVASLYNEEATITEEGQNLISSFFMKNLKELKVDTRSAYHLDGEPAEIDIVIEDYDLEEEEESSVEEISSEEEVIEEWVDEPVIEEPVWEDDWTDTEEPESVWTPPASSETPAPTPPPVEESSSEEPEPAPEPEPNPTPPAVDSGTEEDPEPEEEPNLTPPPPPVEGSSE